jgi:hypothetical protein
MGAMERADLRTPALDLVVALQYTRPVWPPPCVKRLGEDLKPGRPFIDCEKPETPVHRDCLSGIRTVNHSIEGTVMSVARYEPWNVISHLHGEISRIFSNASDVNNGTRSIATADWAPPVDMNQYADRLELFVDVPGVNPKAGDHTPRQRRLDPIRRALIRQARGRGAANGPPA